MPADVLHLAYAAAWIAFGADLTLCLLLLLLLRRHLRVRSENQSLLREKEVIFNFVHDVGEVFSETDAVELNPLLEKVLFYAIRTSRADAGAIHLFDDARRNLQARALTGLFPPLVAPPDLAFPPGEGKARAVEDWVRAHPLPLGASLLDEAAEYGAPILIADAEMEARLPAFADDALRVRTFMAVPMRFHNRVLGVLTVVNRTDGRPFVAGDLSLLQALADQASVSMHFALLREELETKRRLDRELDLARRIQTALLPRELPRVPGLDLAAFSVPALQIGGDYYDFVRVDDRHLGIAIADVSGKGVGGAMLMSVCRSVLRSQAPGCLSPAVLLKALHRVMFDDLREDMFVTVLYLVLNTQTLDLKLARAGHERPLLISGRNGTLTPLESPGAAIGLTPNEVFDSVIRDAAVTLRPGDRIVLFTDGITEAVNAAGEEWGLSRLAQALRPEGEPASADLLDRVRREVLAFAGDQPAYDDMTMVALRVTAEGRPAAGPGALAGAGRAP